MQIQKIVNFQTVIFCKYLSFSVYLRIKFQKKYKIEASYYTSSAVSELGYNEFNNLVALTRWKNGCLIKF